MSYFSGGGNNFINSLVNEEFATCRQEAPTPIIWQIWGQILMLEVNFFLQLMLVALR